MRSHPIAAPSAVGGTERREGEGEGEHLALAARSLKGALKSNLVGVLYCALYATAKTHADNAPREAAAKGARASKCATRPTPHPSTHVQAEGVEDVSLAARGYLLSVSVALAFCNSMPFYIRGYGVGRGGTEASRGRGKHLAVAGTVKVVALKHVHSGLA